jgi:hypothetical protein
MRDRADCLEGSRFVIQQLYRMAAGGSRERLDLRQVYGPLYPSNTDAMGKTLRWAIPGVPGVRPGRTLRWAVTKSRASGRSRVFALQAPQEIGGVASTFPVPGKLSPLISAFTDGRPNTIKEKIPSTIPGIPPIINVMIAKIKRNQ